MHCYGDFRSAAGCGRGKRWKNTSKCKCGRVPGGREKASLEVVEIFIYLSLSLILCLALRQNKGRRCSGWACWRPLSLTFHFLALAHRQNGLQSGSISFHIGSDFVLYYSTLKFVDCSLRALRADRIFSGLQLVPYSPVEKFRSLLELQASSPITALIARPKKFN